MPIWKLSDFGSPSLVVSRSLFAFRCPQNNLCRRRIPNDQRLTTNDFRPWRQSHEHYTRHQFDPFAGSQRSEE